ncbi:MAG: hypothetical protein PPP58_09715 [Natronomonas sp.]
MKSEPTDLTEFTVTVPQELKEWLEDRAEEVGVDAGEALTELLAAHRHLSADADGDDAELDVAVDGALQIGESAIDDRVTEIDDAVADLEDRLDPIDERLSELDRAVSETDDGVSPEAIDDLRDRIEALEADYSESLDDVRRRVLQLRDAVEAAAAADHTHEELPSAQTVESLESQLEDVTETVERLDASVTESAETNAAERLDDVETKLDRLARVVVALRREVGSRDAEAEAALDGLKRAAGRETIEKALCTDCEGTVHIGLLTEPACPHCGFEFRDVQPAQGFFGKPKLIGGDPSPLEEGTDE